MISAVDVPAPVVAAVPCVVFPSILHPILSTIIIKRIRRRFPNIRPIVTRAALLDRGTIGSTGSTGPIDGGLKCGIFGVVLGYTPEVE
ncbi:hypothetical protein HanXRQr2_Chr16g0769591 [Helianthus annuus]|uniref:Uncharacterized protein n=1 Tax=Helianthus annuus TaxID=4232 RepID=A0A9K3DW42_HELAN|nr:hypothetical protein HanXRQr2_Chr16g0769591 [Helianthus annuus]KAJ0822920.1 hypothetical protein HanPSC8_Chr16g0737671 [Helianthus annuus]